MNKEIDAGRTTYPNPPFQEEEFLLHYKRWKDSVGEETLQEEGITEDAMRYCCETICNEFPRGQECGILLWDPIVDDTPLEHRGVSLFWLYGFWLCMTEDLSLECKKIPTRLFVALFVEPLVLSVATKEQKVLPLYYFVPVKHRGKPQWFTSHGWDSWLRHLLYWPTISEPGKNAKMHGHENTFLWLDIIAIVQHPGSVKQQAEVAKITEVVRSIGKTCLIVPGQGSLHFALLPARRSWCCLEIAYTQNLSARVGLNKASFGWHNASRNRFFHRQLIDEIFQLKCSDAETRNEEEKKAIQEVLDRELGLGKADCIVRRAILKAFSERHKEEWPPSGENRIIARMYDEALASVIEQEGRTAAMEGGTTQKTNKTLYPNPQFKEQEFLQHYNRWKDSVGEETLQEEGITEDVMRLCCKTICNEFPRGAQENGLLLWEPIVDDTPLEHRGVSMQWMLHFWRWMTGRRRDISRDSSKIPTRLFVALFVEPLVLHRNQDGNEVLPLYYFLPTQHRGKPDWFLSHGWDSWLRQLLYWPPNTGPTKTSEQLGKESTFLWLDIIAIVQDPGSVRQQNEVAKITEVVRSIGNTCLIVPGHGSTNFALLPARRSWCCLEIAYTQNLSARAGLNKAIYAVGERSYDESKNRRFHESLISEICQLECKNAETRNEDEKRAILGTLDRELGLERADGMVQRAVLQAFHERYRFCVDHFPYNVKSRESFSAEASKITQMYQKALCKFEEKASSSDITDVIPPPAQRVDCFRCMN